MAVRAPDGANNVIKKNRNGDTLGRVKLIVWTEEGNQGEQGDQSDRREQDDLDEVSIIMFGMSE